MARRGRRDRVVAGQATRGGRRFAVRPSGVTLPPSTYRDSERLSGTFDADAAVYGRLLHTDVPRPYAARPLRLLYSSIPFLRSPRPLQGGRGRRAPRSFPLIGDLPYRVRFCVQRKQRREVLFAYSKAGFAGSGRGRWNGFRRSYRRTAASRYAC